MELLVLIKHWLLPSVLAAGPCVGITDCGIGVNPLPAVIFWAAAVLLEIASGLAVLFVVIGGAFMVLNMGNESLAEKGRKGVIYSLIAFGIALSSQAIISFVVVRSMDIDPDAPVLSLIRITMGSMLYVFNTAFAIAMIYYGYKLLIARGQQGELDSVKKGLMYTVAGAFIVNLSFALVRAVSLLGF